MDSITSPSKTYTHITHPTETVDTHAYNSSQSTDYIRSSRSSLHRSRVCVVRTETPFELLISFNTQSTFFFVVENAILFVEPFVVVRRVLFSRLTESLCCARLQISSFWYEMFLRQNAPSNMCMHFLSNTPEKTEGNCFQNYNDDILSAVVYSFLC